MQDHFISIPSTSVQGMYADFAMQAMAHHRALLGLAHDAGAVEVESIFEPDLGVAWCSHKFTEMCASPPLNLVV